MAIRIFQTTADAIHEQRMRYLADLTEPQELFLEMKVRHSNAFGFGDEAGISGYGFVTSDGELTEFYLDPAQLPQADDYFRAVFDQVDIRRIWCKSFDRLLLSLCLDRQLKFTVEGYLYRTRLSNTPSVTPSGIQVRDAVTGDVDMLWSFNDSFFETEEEIRWIIGEERAFVFQSGTTFIGCGTLMHIIPGRLEYDLGMMVNPQYRNKGFGTALINYLAAYCDKQGWRPNAGCAAGNLASQRTLEKAGFVSRDRMLLFHADRSV